jgi:hypothetical protein
MNCLELTVVAKMCVKLGNFKFQKKKVDALNINSNIFIEEEVLPRSTICRVCMILRFIIFRF